jgi:FkbM family methyltransferase
MNMIQKEGYWWPEDCGEKYQASLRRIKSLMVAIRLCQASDRTKTVVQAGGSIGVWPNILSKYFKTVYTFEPEPISFACLYKNVKSENVIKLPIALGNARGPISMDRKSLTAHKVIGSGIIPSIQLDDLALKSCDALLLDVEGFEFNVICGAAHTIAKHNPLILVETHKGNDSGIEGKTITSDQMIASYLTSLGYKKTMHVEMDDIYEKD